MNEGDFAVSPTVGPRQKVAVLPFRSPNQDQELHRLIVEGLQRHPSVDQVRTEYRLWPRTDYYSPDVVVDIKPHASFEGSSKNFLITFPGFLIFTHAWYGYVYYAKVQTELDFYRPGGREPIETRIVETDFELRHCDFGRGFWGSSGWWMPGYGATSLIAAFFMVDYDPDTTTPFVRGVRYTYGDFVAEKIMNSAITRFRLEQIPDRSIIGGH
ncbi:MAG: hypothetical protein ACYTG5_03225 [Planctomycetota bacterium]